MGYEFDFFAFIDWLKGKDQSKWNKADKKCLQCLEAEIYEIQNHWLRLISQDIPPEQFLREFMQLFCFKAPCKTMRNCDLIWIALNERENAISKAIIQFQKVYGGSTI